METVMQIRHKSKFIIVTDMHLWHRNIANRKNYVKECIYSFSQLQETVKKLRSELKPGEKLYLVFLGDIFHHGINSPVEYNNWIQVFTALRSLVNGIFAVVGNHEMTYYQDNPFWGLCNEIKSTVIKNKGLEPTGGLPIITITDQIDVFDTRLHFNHYHTPVYNLGKGRNILFAHDYWSTEKIFKQLALEVDEPLMKLYTRGNQITDGSIIKFFKYCFFGHNHMLYGTYQIDWGDDTYEDTILYYLGSIGLTKRNEVLKVKPERSFPVLTITEDDVSVEEIKITLLQGKEEVLNRETIAEIEQKKAIEDNIEEMISDCRIDTDDPLEQLKARYEKAPKLLETLIALSEGRVPECLQKHVMP